MDRTTLPAVRRRDLAIFGGAALAAAAASPVVLPAQAAPGDRSEPFVADSGVNEPVPRHADLAALTHMQHEWALTRLPHLYAQALDRSDLKTLDQLFTQDALFIRGNGTHWNRADIMNIPNVLRAGYRGTFHSVFNQTFVIKGRTAVGEVYCLARHLYPERDGRYYCNDQSMRYEDEYRLEDDNCWRFSLRRVVLIAHEPMVEIAPPPVS